MHRMRGLAKPCKRKLQGRKWGLERIRRGWHPVNDWAIVSEHRVLRQEIRPPSAAEVSRAVGGKAREEGPEPTGAREARGTPAPPGAQHAMDDSDGDPFAELSD